ncbi:MAG TPA: hypothetical protein VFQ87_06910 [Bradyrhizobium sp.]|nr:hypothetical protein [Bradyrhizobium sp.]
MDAALSDTFKKYGGAVFLGFGAIFAVGLLVGVFWLLIKLIPKDGSGSLALLAIGGVVVLILLLTAVAIVFQILGLTNAGQAMGLPEGSIRAVIALSLIVLFAILSVFLYTGVSTGSRHVIERLTDTDRMQFIRDHTTAQDIQSDLLKGADGKPLKTDDGKENLYNVSYRSANPTSDDFAKQMLVLLGTLMTAVTSFYLGAGTATSAAKAGAGAGASANDTEAASAPTVSDIVPKTYSLASGPSMRLQLTGTNLDSISRVRISKGGVELNGAIVSKTADTLTCTVDVSMATVGVWDLVVDDGGSKSFTKQGALTISP